VKTAVHASILASYVEALENGAKTTTRAEDRGIYTSLLADAATVLACAVHDRSLAQLRQAVQGHERLRGQVWLQDPVQAESTRIWGEAVRAINEHAI
jgi:hypothetical protein